MPILAEAKSAKKVVHAVKDEKFRRCDGAIITRTSQYRTFDGTDDDVTCPRCRKVLKK